MVRLARLTYESGARVLNHPNHIELVVKLVPLVLIEDVHNLFESVNLGTEFKFMK